VVEILDPPEQGGIVGRPKSRNEKREFPGESFHLPIWHVKKEVDAGHTRDKEIRILERMASFTGIHLVEVIHPVIDKFQGELELSSPNQMIVIYDPITSTFIRTFPSLFLCHDRLMGRP
jgi:hypothetical protein